MKPLIALLILTLAATPALAKNYSHANPRAATGCTPSSDPTVAPCGVKDEAPTYFPDKLATPEPAKPTAAADTTTTPVASKPTKHKKPKATTQDTDAQTY